MAADSSTTTNSPRKLAGAATWIAVSALLALLVFLAVVALQKGGADLSGVAPAMVSALLAAVVNPAPDGSSALAGFGPVLWIALVAIAGAVSVLTGLLTLMSSGHPGAAGAFAASIGALGGLLLDTSDFTVVKKLLGGQWR